MRKMKSVLSIGLLLFSLVQTTLIFAAETVTCPSSKQIQQEGLAIADSNNEYYVASNRSQYDTNNQWLFAVGNMQASSKQDAIAKANVAIVELTPMGEAIHNEVDNVWICVYNAKDLMNHKSYMAVAVTPVPKGKSVNDMLVMI